MNVSVMCLMGVIVAVSVDNNLWPERYGFMSAVALYVA